MPWVEFPLFNSLMAVVMPTAMLVPPAELRPLIELSTNDALVPSIVFSPISRPEGDVSGATPVALAVILKGSAIWPAFQPA